MVLGLCAALSQRGWEMIIGHNQPNKPLADEFRRARASVVGWDTKNRFDLGAVTRLAGMIHRQRIDLIHSHGRRYDFWGTMAACLCRRPIVITRHTPLIEVYSPGIRRNAYLVADSFALQLASTIVVPTGGGHQALVAQGISSEKIRVIPNGIDLNRFSPGEVDPEVRAVLGLSPSATVIGTLATLHAHKGQDVLLQAAQIVLKCLPDVYFLLVGGGPMRDRLVSQASELGVQKRVIFAGERQHISQILKCLTLLVIPSLREGLPMVLLEAMMSGVPVVATNVGGIPEVIEPGVTGILVPPGNHQALAQGILTALEDKARLARIGAEALRVARKRFSLAQMAGKYEEVYEQLLLLGSVGQIYS